MVALSHVRTEELRHLHASLQRGLWQSMLSELANTWRRDGLLLNYIDGWKDRKRIHLESSKISILVKVVT